MTGGLLDLLGMGLVIELRNMFSVPALAVQKSAQALTNSLVGNQRQINDGFKLMAGGASAMLLGSGMIAGIMGVTKVAMEASSQIEILHNQINVLAKSPQVGNALFGQLRDFSKTVPFTIDKVYEAGRNLLAFGFKQDQIMKEMQVAGEWAAMFPDRSIEQVTAFIGKARQGGNMLGYAMRSMGLMGISYRDIEKFGGPIDHKTHAPIKGADPEKIIDALNKAVLDKFAGGMKLYMTTLPGMWTNFRDQVRWLEAEMGDRFNHILKDILSQVLAIFTPDLISPFATAIGDMLGTILHMTIAILTPLAQFVVWTIKLSNTHPGLFKMAGAFVFIIGLLLNLGGAAMIALGVFRMLQYLVGANVIAALGGQFLGLMGPLGWVLAGVALFATIWHYNFFGIRDTLISWFQSTKMVVSGVLALLGTMTGSTGTMSKTMFDSLRSAGLLDIVIGLYMAFYRLKAMLRGVWDMFKIVWQVIAQVAAAALFLLWPVKWLIEKAFDLGEHLGWVSNQMSSSAYYRFGVVLGGVAVAGATLYGVLALIRIGMAAAAAWTAVWNGVLIIAKGAMMAWRLACLVAQGAQWALNAAMAANPIGLIIIGIGLAIIAVTLFVTHLRQISAWFQNLPGWAKLIFTAFFPFVTAAIQIYQHWGQIKQWFQGFGEWLHGLWDTVIDYLYNKILGLWTWLKGIVQDVKGWFEDHRDVIVGKETQLTEPQKTQLRQVTMDALPAASPFAMATGQAVPQAPAVHKPLPPIHIHTQVHLDGKVVGKSVTQYQQDKSTEDSW